MAGQEREIADLEKRSSQPGFWDDPQRAQSVMRRLAEAREQVDTWRGLGVEVGELSDLLELAEAEQDEATAADVAADIEALSARVDKLELSLALSGEYDRRSAIMAVHAGAGGTDSQDWADMLLRMYLRWAEGRGYQAHVLDMTVGEEAGIKSAMVEVTGRNAYGYLRAERGVHRLVRLSPFDFAHARHTSFALVEVMPEVEDVAEVTIDPDDLRIDVFRASSHGGQHVQKNATAVRITHIPSGIVVSCQNERSQYRNKEIAMKVLQARLLERELERQAEEKTRLKGEHVSAAWGNQIRSYVLHPYKMVKDHRTGYETSDAEAVLDGELDEFLRAYQKATLGKDGE
ncbi:MAG: peptide chain release factor 2 [Dehalococcoidia bacterium SM23_28_2]|nr:MAG: peptide chain release factor 2 [Dehalococcoidia bacterium SM23_28_2]